MDAKQIKLILSWNRRAKKSWKDKDAYSAFMSQWIAFNAFCYARYVKEAVRNRADLSKFPPTITDAGESNITGVIKIAGDIVKINISLPERIGISIRRRYTEDLLFVAFERDFSSVHDKLMKTPNCYRQSVETLRAKLRHLDRSHFEGEPYIINMARVRELDEQPSLKEAEDRGIVIVLDDDTFPTLRKLLYQIRCNIFHGEKTPGGLNDDRVVFAAYPVLSEIMDELIRHDIRLSSLDGASWREDNAGVTIKSLAHVCIKTTDLKKTTEFYCDALRMEKLFTFTRSGAVIGFYMKAANTSFIEVFVADEVQRSGKQPLDHFCLETEDIKALQQSLLKRGYAPGEIKTGADNSWQFWMEDPNGLNIEFHQYTEKSSQFTGADVEVNW